MTSDASSHVQPPLLPAALGLAVVLLVWTTAEPAPAPVGTVTGALVQAAAVAVAAPVPTPPTPEGTVHLAVPAGVLAITTPYTAAGPLVLSASGQGGSPTTAAPFGSSTDIARAVKILDTRPAELGFVAQVATADPGADPHAGLVGVTAVQVQGNGLRSADVHATDAPPDGRGLTTPQVVASYAAGLGIGTAWLTGTLELTDGAAGSRDGAVTVTFTAF